MPPDAHPSPAPAAVAEGVPSFDLTTQPWLPVLRHDGVEKELSLTELFEQAEEIRRVPGDLPTQEFALVRLLLAVLYDALDGGPAERGAWEELWTGGPEAFPVARITGYLAEHRERFDLLHPERPFFQVADLRTDKEDVFPLDRIVADVPSNDRFLTMRAHGAQRLSFAEAARWVVHVHAWDVAGIKSGAVGDPRKKAGKVYPNGVGSVGMLGGVLVEGLSLRETLLLNLVPRDETALLQHDDRDLPVWRRPQPPGAAPETDADARPYGPRDLYTWQARRVRLHHDGREAYGVVLAYGDPLPYRNMHGREPMSGWRRSEQQEKKLRESPVYLPRTHDPSRTAWRGLASLITGYPPEAVQKSGRGADPGISPRVLAWLGDMAVESDALDRNHVVRARLLGCRYGTQQSVVADAVDDSLDMSLVLLSPDDPTFRDIAVQAVQLAEKAVWLLGNLASGLAQAAGADQETPRAEARDRGFGDLDDPFRHWLARLGPDTDPEALLEVWRRTAHDRVRALGLELVEGSGEAAWEGRVLPTAQGGTYWLNSASVENHFRRQLRVRVLLPEEDDSTDTTGDAPSADRPEEPTP
ncbi:type I-E CRISPR-associated protein Cse1/CasA [Streptomyces sp. Z26]|uniref:type I-E CRISPR-associated protein Cse1/CasA n=1 Tax=Streptomyces sp. Z26 TaxID=2500177 RepID=UPI001F0BC70D|nr:type I-E CRISPR-associated protein Cse1/CasA [Streptomyces sp. Z26]